MEVLRNKVKTMNEIRSYFYKYVLMYMEEYCNIESHRDIDQWTLSEPWLHVEYYSEETDNDEELCIPSEQFFDYIKSKESAE